MDPSKSPATPGTSPCLKALAVEVKDDEAGTVEARFSTYDVIDSDGDVTRQGAFTDGQEVRISAWNHGSWSGALPVGKGVIRDRGDHAVLEGQFFLSTAAGREHFEVVKGLGPLQEWSYGYTVTKASFGEFEEREVRFLEGLDVTEVAPVLKGAGIATRTLVVKSADAPDLAVEIPTDDSQITFAYRGTQYVLGALKQSDPNPDDPSSDDDEAADRKRRDTDLLRLVAATHGIPTGGTS